MGGVVFAAAWILYCVVDYLKLFPSYIVLSSCDQASNPAVTGKTIVVPAECPVVKETSAANVFYWADPTQEYVFKNFAPCADDEGRVKCYPVGRRAAFVSFEAFNQSKLAVESIRFDPDQSVHKVLRSQLKPTTKQLFHAGNLLYSPIV